MWWPFDRFADYEYEKSKKIKMISIISQLCARPKQAQWTKLTSHVTDKSHLRHAAEGIIKWPQCVLDINYYVGWIFGWKHKLDVTFSNIVATLWRIALEDDMCYLKTVPWTEYIEYLKDIPKPSLKPKFVLKEKLLPIDGHMLFQGYGDACTWIVGLTGLSSCRCMALAH